MLVQDVGRDKSVAEANTALKASAPFKCSRAILQAQFGYCIEYAEWHLPRFNLDHAAFDILHDRRIVSVLPYILDQMGSDSRWIYFIRGLVELERFDLLGQVALLAASPHCVTQPVGAAAAKSFEKISSTLEPSAWFSAGRFEALMGTVPEKHTLPLRLLQSLYEKRIAVSNDCILLDDLLESSLLLWMLVLGEEVGEAKELLALAVKHGDDQTGRLASAFHRPVSIDDVRGLERDVYQAMLIRLRFHPICNAHVIQNYEKLLRGLPEVGYHTACALFDCGKHELACQYGFGAIDDADLDSLLDRLIRLQSAALSTLIPEYVRRFQDAPKLLRRLIQRGVDDAHIKLVWDMIQGAGSLYATSQHSCSVPVEALKRLVFERDISVENVEKMLGVLTGFQENGKAVSREVHVLYTLVFWEAPEPVIDHFIGLIPDDFRLNCALVWRLLFSTTRSNGLCRKLIRHMGLLGYSRRARLLKFRPDLIEELAF